MIPGFLPVVWKDEFDFDWDEQGVGRAIMFLVCDRLGLNPIKTFK